MRSLSNSSRWKIVPIILLIVIVIFACSFPQWINGLYQIKTYPERMEGDIEIRWNGYRNEIEVYNRYNLKIKIRLYDNGGWSNYDPPDAILPIVNFTDNNGENAIEKDYTISSQYSTIYRISLRERYENHAKFNSADLFIHIGIRTPYGDKVTENSTTIRIYI